MKINNISVENFRNLQNLNLEFFEGMNVFCGENGMGKTNLIEAIWMLTGAKSFRHSKDLELVCLGKDSAKIKAEVFSGKTIKQISLEFSNKRKAFISDKPLKSASMLTDHFNAVIFSPQDMALASEGPAIKRRFLDLCLCQLFPRYLSALKAYGRLLDQRNSVLKDTRYHPELLDLILPIEEQMSAAAEIITEYRTRLCLKISEHFQNIYDQISGGKESVSIEYLSKSGENLFETLQKTRKDDILIGTTTYGPHRDDLLISMNGNGVRGFSSQGQKRCAALSLKLAEAEVIESVKGESPIILLDDVMSELDPLRQSRVFSALQSRQIFISCCDENNIEGLSNGKVFKISDGGVLI